MKFFDLFAGIGGFRLGMERNGHECIGSCEIDQYARQIYSRNFGHEPEYKDATKLNPKELPDFQCLCAGFPCQSFSLAGHRGGFEDTRGTLFFEIIRIAREKQPSILFLENVKGLLSHDKGKTYRTILTTLDEVGYDVSFQLVNSKYFLPQNRDRIFIIGHLRGASRQEILPLGEISEGDDRTSKNGDKIELEAKHINVTKHNGSRVYSKDGIAPSVMAGEGSGTRIKIIEPKLKKVGIIGKGGQGMRVYSIDGIASNLNALSGGMGAKTGLYLDRNKVPMIYKSNTNANMKQRIQNRDSTWTLTTKSTDFGLIVNVPKPDDVSRTVRVGGRGSIDRHSWDIIDDNTRVRRLTPTECERLQGFPDGYTIGISETQRYKCLGNAVTVNTIQYIASFF